MSKRYICILFAIVLSLAFAACSDDPLKDVKKGERSDADRAALERTLDEDGSPEQETASETGSSAEDEDPPEGALGISPLHPQVGSQLKIRVPGMSDLSDLDVQWYLNGAPLSGFSSSTLDLEEAEVKKGDKVYGSAFVDGADLSTAEVTVENTPPRIVTSRIMPEAFKPGDRIYLDVGTEDADGDKVQVEYEWFVNDTPAGTERELDTKLKRGDAFEVRIAPYDGEEYGDEEVVLVSVGNLPPVMEGHYDYTFDGTTYTYQSRATDPDGDELTYSLKSGPDGMEIDSSTGEVTWEVPEDFVGTAEYVIIVEDGSGGTARMEQGFRLTLEGP